MILRKSAIVLLVFMFSFNAQLSASGGQRAVLFIPENELIQKRIAHAQSAAAAEIVALATTRAADPSATSPQKNTTLAPFSQSRATTTKSQTLSATKESVSPLARLHANLIPKTKEEWKKVTEQWVPTPLQPITQWPLNGSASAVDLHPNGNLIAVALSFGIRERSITRWTGNVEIQDAHTGQELYTLPYKDIGKIAWNHQGTRLALFPQCSGNDPCIRICNPCDYRKYTSAWAGTTAYSLSEPVILRGSGAHYRAEKVGAWTSDDARIAIAFSRYNQHKVTVFNAQTGAAEQDFEHEGYFLPFRMVKTTDADYIRGCMPGLYRNPNYYFKDAQGNPTLREGRGLGAFARIAAIKWSKYDSQLITTCENQTKRWFDAQTGELVKLYPTDEQGWSAAQKDVDEDDGVLAQPCAYDNEMVFDRRTGVTLHTLKTNNERQALKAWSRDGTQFATVPESSATALSLWSIGHRRPLCKKLLCLFHHYNGRNDPKKMSLKTIAQRYVQDFEEPLSVSDIVLALRKIGPAVSERTLLSSSDTQVVTTFRTLDTTSLNSLLSTYNITLERELPNMDESTENYVDAYQAFEEVWDVFAPYDQSFDEASQNLFNAIEVHKIKMMDEHLNEKTVIARNPQENMRTPLMHVIWCAKSDNQSENELFTALLNYKKDDNHEIYHAQFTAVDSDGNTALMLAVAKGCLHFALRIAQKMDAAPSLHHAFARKNSNQKTAYDLAHALKERAFLNDGGYYDFLIKILEKHKAHPTIPPHTSIKEILREYIVEEAIVGQMIPDLEATDEDKRACDQTTQNLFKAIRKHDLKAMNENLNHKTIVGRLPWDLKTPLMEAIHCADLGKQPEDEVFKTLLGYQKEFKVDSVHTGIACSNLAAVDPQGNTPLMLAIAARCFNFALRIAHKMDANPLLHYVFRKQRKSEAQESAYELAADIKRHYLINDGYYDELMKILAKHHDFKAATEKRARMLAKQQEQWGQERRDSSDIYTLGPENCVVS